jgi:hypothetical protein
MEFTKLSPRKGFPLSRLFLRWTRLNVDKAETRVMPLPNGSDALNPLQPMTLDLFTFFAPKGGASAWFLFLLLLRAAWLASLLTPRAALAEQRAILTHWPLRCHTSTDLGATEHVPVILFFTRFLQPACDQCNFARNTFRRA